MINREAGIIKPAGDYVVNIRASAGGVDIDDLVGERPTSRTVETTSTTDSQGNALM